METSQLICSENQRAGFYMMGHWSLKGLIQGVLTDLRCREIPKIK